MYNNSIFFLPICDINSTRVFYKMLLFRKNFQTNRNELNRIQPQYAIRTFPLFPIYYF